MSRETLYLGTSESAEGPVLLNAGPLALRFDPESTFLRQVRIGDHEIVRAIYGAVRDKNWTTVRPKLSGLKIDSQPDAFQISFKAEHRRDDIHFVWTGEILGASDGTVKYSFDGEALSGFQRMRIGLCALHPIIECAGKPVTVEHVDGPVEEGTFPQYVSPVEPFKDIRAVSYGPAPLVKVRLQFEGDVFEMEDQRNWSDASFKTYSTPAHLPRPVVVEKGTRIRQTVTISLPGNVRKILPVLQGRDPQISISTTTVFEKPPLGLQVASHGVALSEKEVARLKSLQISHLRVDLATLNDVERLRRATDEARAIGAGLHVALHLGENAEAELDEFVSRAKSVAPPVSLWLVFKKGGTSPGDGTVRLAKAKLSEFGPNIFLATGSLRHFYDLNGHRPGADSNVVPCVAMSPQVHAFDETTLVENLAGQASVVESIRQLSARPPVVSPVTLLPNALPDPKAQIDSALPVDVDVRQMSLFGAAWTLGSFAKLATSGKLHSLTYFETTGWRGIMETEAGPPLPDQFPSIPGIVFPSYFVFAWMAGYPHLYATHSSHPLQVEAITLLNEKKQRRLLVGNFLGKPQSVKIKSGTCNAKVLYLDETNAESAMCGPESYLALGGETISARAGKLELEMKPYALARVDIF